MIYNTKTTGQAHRSVKKRSTAMILNNFDHCPLPAARNWFAALASFTATAAFLCALQQSAQVMRWLPHA